MNNQNELHKLIDLYFDGLTTLEQESQLKQLLAISTDTSDSVTAARAVLSYTCHKPHNTLSVGHKKSRKLQPLAIAASAALLIAACATAFLLHQSPTLDINSSRHIAAVTPHPHHNADAYYRATIGGKVVNDQATVEALMLNQLSELNEANNEISKTINNDIDLLRKTFNQSL